MRWIGGDGDLRRSVELVDIGSTISWVPTQATYTATGLDFGDPNPRRIIAVGIPMQSFSNNSALVSGSIGGVTASIAIQNDNNYTAILYARVPTGTSGDVVLTIDHVSDFIQFTCLYVYRIIAKDITPVFTGKVQANSSPLGIAGINFLKKSVTMGVSNNNHASAVSYVAVTEDDDNASAGTSCFHRGPEPADVGPTGVTMFASGSGTNAFSMASWL